jgi:hypothetical protein
MGLINAAFCGAFCRGYAKNELSQHKEVHMAKRKNLDISALIGSEASPLAASSLPPVCYHPCVTTRVLAPLE